MKRLTTLIVLVALLVVALPTQAQGDATPIAYGETVQGEITNGSYEVFYTFTGTAGDIVVAELTQGEPYGSLYDPALILTDPAGSTLGMASDFNSATLAAILPEDGDYTLLVTREEGANATDEGLFNLRLVKVEALEVGSTVQGTVTSTEFAYYALQTDKPFTVSYEWGTGTLYPEVAITVMDNEGSLANLAFVSGLYLTNGSIGFEMPNARGTENFIIVVRQPSWNYDTGLTADYSLTLEQ